MLHSKSTEKSVLDFLSLQWQFIIVSALCKMSRTLWDNLCLTIKTKLLLIISPRSHSTDWERMRNPRRREKIFSIFLIFFQFRKPRASISSPQTQIIMKKKLLKNIFLLNTFLHAKTFISFHFSFLSSRENVYTITSTIKTKKQPASDENKAVSHYSAKCRAQNPIITEPEKRRKKRSHSVCENLSATEVRSLSNPRRADGEFPCNQLKNHRNSSN